MFHNILEENVRDYMSKVVATLRPETDIFTATDIFFKNVFHRMPVVEGKKILSIISRRDVLKVIKNTFEDENMSVPHELEEPKEYLSPEMKGVIGDDAIS